MLFAALLRCRGAALVIGLLLVPAVAQISQDPEVLGPGNVLFRFDGLRLGLDHDRNSGEKLNSLAVASTLMSLGLTSRLDLQLGVDFYLRESLSLKAAKATRSGLGDITVRTKWLVWDDEPTGQKLALIPWVKLPSNTGGLGNHSVEGGLVVPWTRTQGEFTFGATAEVDLRRNPADTRYDAAWQGSTYLSREIFKPLSVYAEALVAIPRTGLSQWAASGGGGLKFEATKHLELEYEVVRGFNARATDWLHFVRLNWRW